MDTVIDAGRLRRARIGVSMLFMANGAMWANIVPRLPDIRERLDVGYGAFGVAVAFASIGAIVLGLSSGSLVRRFGSARVATVALALQAFAVWGAGAAPSIVLFATFLFINGALDANTDVAQNAHGLIVQKRMGKSIINSLHAMWSAGAAVGGLLGQYAVSLDLSIQVHLAIATAVFATVAVIAKTLMLPDDAARPVEEEAAASESAPPVRRFGIPAPAALALGALGLVAIAGALVEDAGFTWSSNYLADDLHASKSVIGYGLVGLMTLHFVGRIVGDRLVDRYGERAVARIGGLITAVGMGAALAWPTVPGTIVGFSLAGLGVATTVPAAFSASDSIPGLKHGTGVTITSWLLRISFLAGPPVVGAIADATSLRTGLIAVPLAGLAVMLLAGNLSGRSKPVNAVEPQPSA